MNDLRLLDIGSANPRLDKGWSELDKVQVVMFEPDERSYQEIKDNESYENVEIYNYALDEVSRKRKLYLTRKPELTSFYEPNTFFVNKFPNASRWDILKDISLETKSLNSIYDQIGEYDFIKIDTQGSELDILKGAVNGGLESCLGIESEVEFLEIYKNQPLFGDVCMFLSKQGFIFMDFVVEYRYGRFELDRTGQLSFADALFLRSPEWIIEKYTIKQITIEKVYKYLQVCDVYKKKDLTKLVIEQLGLNNNRD